MAHYNSEVGPSIGVKMCNQLTSSHTLGQYTHLQIYILYELVN